MIGHFGDESFKATDCTSTDNSQQPNELYRTKHTKTNPNRTKLENTRTQT